MNVIAESMREYKEFSGIEKERTRESAKTTFIDICKEYTRKAMSSLECIWNGGSVVTWAKRNGIRIGRKEKMILEYLQDRYFLHNMPCYTRLDYFTERLGIGKTGISKILSSLERKGLIHKIDWCFKDTKLNAMVLPRNPGEDDGFFRFQEFDEDVEFPEISKLQSCVAVLLPRTATVKAFERSFILFINIIYYNSSNMLKKSINPFFESAAGNRRDAEGDIFCFQSDASAENRSIEPDPDTIENNSPLPIDSSPPLRNTLKLLANQSENTDERRIVLKPKRYKLKMKQSENPLQKALRTAREINNPIEKESDSYVPFAPKFPWPEYSSKLREAGFEWGSLGNREMRANIRDWLEMKFGINPEDYWKIPKEKKAYSIHMIECRKQFVELATMEMELRYDIAERVMNHWNSTFHGNPKIQRISIKDESKTYRCAVISISHAYHLLAGKNESSLILAIDRVREMMDMKNTGKFPWNIVRGKIEMGKFFLDSRISNFVGTDEVFKHYIYEKKIYDRKSNNPMFDEFRRVYLEKFYPSGNTVFGDKTCYNFEWEIRKFLEEIMHPARLHDLDLCGMDFASSSGNAECESASIIEQYVYWLHRERYNFDDVKDGFVKILDITNKKFWKRFVIEHVRGELGHDNFFKEREQ